MKNLFYALATIALLFSCTDESTNDSTANNLQPESELVSLLSKTSLNDGSIDNIIDQANCFTLQLPLTVTVNGTVVVIDAVDDYDEVEDIFDEFDTDVDTIVISYPVTAILSDYTTQVLNSDADLQALAATCPDENEDDDDIECIDFQYPITVSIYDDNGVLVNDITITNDQEMYDFVDDLEDYDDARINFPITLIRFDGSTVVVNNMTELEFEIEAADDDCDEDDDYDYNDDDDDDLPCDNCTVVDVQNFLMSCMVWEVEELEVNDVDETSQYTGFTFTFAANGELQMGANGALFVGAWSVTESNGVFTLTLNHVDIPLLNGDWEIEEFENDSNEASIELENDNEDELEFVSTC